MKTFPPLAIEGRKADGSPDLSTPRGRALAFNARIDALTLPIAKGGPGLSFNAAIERMQDTPEDSSLLAAMGYQRKTFWNAEAKPPSSSISVGFE